MSDVSSLYCRQCKKVRIEYRGKGASISYGKGVALKCNVCGLDLVSKEDLENESVT